MYVHVYIILINKKMTYNEILDDKSDVNCLSIFGYVLNCFLLNIVMVNIFSFNILSILSAFILLF